MQLACRTSSSERWRQPAGRKLLLFSGPALPPLVAMLPLTVALLVFMAAVLTFCGGRCWHSRHGRHEHRWKDVDAWLYDEIGKAFESVAIPRCQHPPQYR